MQNFKNTVKICRKCLHIGIISIIINQNSFFAKFEYKCVLPKKFKKKEGFSV